MLLAVLLPLLARGGASCEITGRPIQQRDENAFSILPADVVRNICECCEDPALVMLSQINQICRDATHQDRINRKDEKKQLFLGLVQGFESFQRHTASKKCDLPLCDSKREIMNYLNGFEGHIEWMMAYAMKHMPHSSMCNQVRGLQAVLTGYREKYTLEFKRPLHRRQSQIGSASGARLIAFHKFIALRDECNTRSRFLFPGMIICHPSMGMSVWKLLIEQIGVIIEYPGIPRLEHMDSNPLVAQNHIAQDLWPLHSKITRHWSQNIASGMPGPTSKCSLYWEFGRDFLPKLRDFMQKRKEEDSMML